MQKSLPSGYSYAASYTLVFFLGVAACAVVSGFRGASADEYASMQSLAYAFLM